jgi:hypothetical protein
MFARFVAARAWARPLPFVFSILLGIVNIVQVGFGGYIEIASGALVTLQETEFILATPIGLIPRTLDKALLRTVTQLPP